MKIVTRDRICYIITLINYINIVYSSVIVPRVDVPPWVEAGGSADLKCYWEVEPGDRLRTVKWYQGHREIYRYTPGKGHLKQDFHNDNLDVDLSKSSGGQVHITNVSVSSSGYFRCEVSGDAPAFATAQREQKLTVVVLPEGGPQMIGLENRYEKNDWVDLTCQTSPAKPAPTLRFLINGLPPQHSHLEAADSFTSYPEPILKSSSLRIRFRLEDRHLFDPLAVEGEARISCIAEVPEIEYMESIEVVLSDRPRYIAAGMEGHTSTSVKDQQVHLLALGLGITLLGFFSWIR